MYKILFAKNMLGEETELLNFIEKKFDVLVLTFSGSQISSAKKSIEYVHTVKSKLYFRSFFVPSAGVSDIFHKAETRSPNRRRRNGKLRWPCVLRCNVCRARCRITNVVRSR